MTGAALLDVNLLVALFDPDHVHHELAHDWFSESRASGWATCAVTENGLVRVLANPKYGSQVSGVPAILERLAKFRSSGHHRYWDGDVSLTDSAVFKPALIRGHRQVTDVYLLGLAVKHGGRLATFDRSIPAGAVVGATAKKLEVIGPVEDD
jgi:toxin-antitoxin system PIN domain toxin